MKKKHEGTVMVFGTFDRLHLGHVHVLEMAQKHGTTLIAVIARDSTVQRVKGHIPLYGERERMRALKLLSIANRVILGNTRDYLAVVRTVNPSVICLGYDQEAMVALLKQYKKKERPSLKIVRARALEQTRFKSSLLPKNAHPLPIRGVVLTGKGEGRKIGFPTANIHAPQVVRRTCAPGIYASEVYLEGVVYQGATVVGVRMEKRAPLVETHIIGLRRNLYHKTITVVLDKKIRDIKHYTTQEALQKDVERDVSAIKAFYKGKRHRTRHS